MKILRFGCALLLYAVLLGSQILGAAEKFRRGLLQLEQLPLGNFRQSAGEERRIQSKDS